MKRTITFHPVIFIPLSQTEAGINSNFNRTFGTIFSKTKKRLLFLEKCVNQIFSL